jgi:hypothetical protein
MRTIIRSAWLPVTALLGVTTAVFGLAFPDSTPQPIKIWDAAFYDSEDCNPGLQVEVAWSPFRSRSRWIGDVYLESAYRPRATVPDCGAQFSSSPL